MYKPSVQSHIKSYSRFTSKSQLDRAVNTLIGIVEGISIDGVINSAEQGMLTLWLAEHETFSDLHPFNELLPIVKTSISDRVLDEDERADILWLCVRLQRGQFLDDVTAHIQVLHGLLGGIAADGKVTKEELMGLREWIYDHEHLRRSWPYDEVDSLITSVLQDGIVDEAEQKLLQGFFGEFVSLLDDRTITAPKVSIDGAMQGVCAVCPEIIFKDAVFCFTGASNRLTRADFFQLVEQLGGSAVKTVSKKVDYLVIGAEGNPCWAYACYGRKVEEAVGLRRNGAQLLIVHENDFHDAVMDYS